MLHKVQIKLHGSLKDFLPENSNKGIIVAGFDGSPAVKDTIESVGIPHAEIGRIEVNGLPFPYSFRIHENDEISVYPVEWKKSNDKELPLQPKIPESLRFVLDVHLGKLARELRLLGFDSQYKNDLSDEQIIEIGVSGKRIFLTRDVGILKNSKVEYGHWMRSTEMIPQVKEVMEVFGLRNRIQPFSICLKCNGRLLSVEKESVSDELPAKVRENQLQIFQCEKCRQLFWKGTHYDHMINRIHKDYGIIV